jgi:hydroxymethylpyrimidine pyrophosphatase-like HAD family hydrolase
VAADDAAGRVGSPDRDPDLSAGAPGTAASPGAADGLQQCQRITAAVGISVAGVRVTLSGVRVTLSGVRVPFARFAVPVRRRLALAEFTAVARPRLIVSDLDGTFLAPDGSIPAVNVAAVQRAAAMGVGFVAATGRPTRWLGVLAELGTAQPLVIAANGAVLWDLAAGRVVEASGIEVDLLRSVIAALRTAIPGLSFGVETPDGFACEPSCPAARRGTVAVLAAGQAGLLDVQGPVVKLLGFHPDLDAGPLADLAERAVGQVVTVTHSAPTGEYGLVEISAPGVSKASALQRLCRRLGIAPEGVAVFGDMPNDADMLAWAGMPHVVANAHPALLASGFPVVGSNAEAGVGRGIIALLQ